MEYEPAEYQKLEIRQFPARSLRETAEGKYWRRFKAPVLAKQVSISCGNVTSAASTVLYFPFYIL